VLVATPAGHGVRERLLGLLRPSAADRLTSAFGLADRVRPTDAALWAAGYALSWVALGVAFVLFAGAFHPAVDAAPRYVAGTVAAAYLMGYLFVIVPAGLGVREGAMFVLLQQIMPEPGGRRRGRSAVARLVHGGGTTAPGGPAMVARTSSGGGGNRVSQKGLVIIPTYNERENLPRLVPQVLAQDERLDVLIIDDASPDGTGPLADEIAADSTRVHVIHRPAKLGLGTAYLVGFRWGLDRSYDWLFEMDADFSHDPAHLPTFIEALEDHDLALGSRYLDGRVTVVNWPIARLLLSYFANVYARVITGVPLWDATGGFKAFHRHGSSRASTSIASSPKGTPSRSRSTSAPGSAAIAIAEIPIVFVDRSLGESKMSKHIIREAVWRVWVASRPARHLRPPLTTSHPPNSIDTTFVTRCYSTPFQHFGTL
jgi:dolichol-phosphate mannosyltransferase